MSNLSYVASVGKSDKERLSIQHETFAKGTEAFLNRLGITQGMNVLVVGCRCGDEAIMIAKKVGVSGTVMAVDINIEQIAIAQERVNEEKLANVTFKVLAAENLSELNAKFDMVYCRMALVHVTDPKQVLGLMKECTKEGGVVACEEPEISSCFSIPPIDAYKKHIRLLCDFIKKGGGDPYFGSKIYQVFHNIGFSHINIEFFQPGNVHEITRTT